MFSKITRMVFFLWQEVCLKTPGQFYTNCVMFVLEKKHNIIGELCLLEELKFGKKKLTFFRINPVGECLPVGLIKELKILFLWGVNFGNTKTMEELERDIKACDLRCGLQWAGYN